MNLTFLNSLFLAGIAAGLVPIVIHLLNRRQLRRIEFSDLRFLGPLNQQRMRSLNLRRLLLLLLRVAIIVFTAVAMARPSVRGSFSRLLPTEARSSVVLLVDTSYSMRTEGEDGTALDRAKMLAGRILDALERGDQATLVRFDAAAHAEFERPVHDLALVRDRVEKLEASHAGTQWVPAMRAALEILSQSTEPNRELYVISDFAGANLDSIRAGAVPNQGDVRITFVPAAVEPFVNVSLEDVYVPPGAVLVDEPVHVTVSARNHAPDVPAECAIQIELSGDPKGEAHLRLAGGAVDTHEFTLVATHPDAVAGVVRKRIDRLPEDDARYFVLPVLKRLHVLLVKGTGDAGGSFFVSRALLPTRGSRSPVELTEIDAARFGTRDLQDIQAVVLASDAALTPSQGAALVEFVDGGGGLFVFSGQRATAEITNRTVLEPLGGARVRGVVEQANGFVNLSGLRPTGILAGFKDPELQTLEAVKFTRHAELLAAGGERALHRFSGGAPALVEGAHGAGKFMVAAFDAGLDGSDLAVSPMFLPLVHRAVVYLAGETGQQRGGVKVGERIEVQVPIAAATRRASAPAREEIQLAQAGTPDGGVRFRSTPPAGAAGDRNFTVTTPAGVKEAAAAHEVGKMLVVSYENTQEPGHYVFEGAGQRVVRAVNIDTQESDLRQADLGDLARRLGIAVAATLQNQDDIARNVQQARHGKELYKLVVGLVLLLLTAELLLSRAARESEAA